MSFRSHERVPQESEDLGHLFTLVLRIEHHMADPVKARAKNTPSRSLMLFDRNRFDNMSPSTNMASPAKRNGHDGKERI